MEKDVQRYLLGRRLLQEASDPTGNFKVRLVSTTFNWAWLPSLGIHHLLVQGLEGDSTWYVYSCVGFRSRTISVQLHLHGEHTISVAVNQYSLLIQIASYSFSYLMVSIHSAKSALSHLIVSERLVIIPVLRMRKLKPTTTQNHPARK